MTNRFSRRQPQKAYPTPAALRNEFSESLYLPMLCSQAVAFFQHYYH
jgi:hypothetical protein